MPNFRYQGRDLEGRQVRGEVEAPSEEVAADLIVSKGVIPLSITQGGGQSSLNVDIGELLGASIPLEVLVIFCRQMYSLTSAGIPLLRALKGLAANTSNNMLKRALEEVAAELANGRSLSVCMKAHPKVFSPLFVSLVNVGENTGRLDSVLHQLGAYYELELETRKRIKSAMRYPVFVIAFIIIALGVLNYFVIPQFADMFSRFGVDLPLPTRIIMASSDFVVNYWSWMLAAMFGSFFAFKAWIKTPKGNELWDRTKLRMPIAGSIINRSQMARFSRTFALMLKSGVPLNQSIAFSAEAMGNRYLELRLMEMKSAIESGSSISSAAIASGVFLPLVIQMISVGEETGRIDELLLEVADFYDREVDYDLKTLTARIEPILLLFVAAIVLILALGIFLPMWGMFDVIQGK